MFLAYILKPFIVFAVLCLTGIIAWCLRKWMKPGKLKDTLLSRI